MKYELINPPNEKYSAKEQIFINRGISEKEIYHYMNLTDDDINSPKEFGEELMYASALLFTNHLNEQNVICVIVDADADGYCSSAMLLNYIYDITNEEYVNSHVHWYMHEGKQHGLSDCMDWLEDMCPDLVIVPDGGSNDAEYLNILEEKGIDVLILDHHEVEIQDYWRTIAHPHLYLINNQFSFYPNKFLCGCGVVYQFCKYVSQFMGIENKPIEDLYLDLVATALIGDMMSLHSFETRRLITKGLNPELIRNPFIYEMWQKNKFKLGEKPTAWGFTFYIVPFINAITRTGTLEEKELIFESMLKFKAFQQIPSNKRGHKLGEMERLVDQAIRTCTNVKNRQTRDETAGLELVEHLIEENNMLDHKVLLFKLEPGQIRAEVRGLLANKLQAKYQRPCCMLTKTIDKNNKISYQGSARGCDLVGVSEFKDICAETQVCDYTAGHQGAFGLGIPAESIDKFIEKTDLILSNMSSEPVYFVDYIWTPDSLIAPSAVLEIGELADYWGQGIHESLVAIRGLQVTKDNIQMMASNTVKITLPNGISLIKFRMPDEEYNKLYSENGYVEIDVVGIPAINNWNGNQYPQIQIKDYEIVGRCAYVF